MELKIDDIFKYFTCLIFIDLIGATIKTPTEKVEKMFSHRKNVNKPVGGTNVPEMFIKKEELQELKVKSLLLSRYTFICLLITP